VNDARRVRSREAASRRHDHAHDLAPGARLLLHPLAQRDAIEELHRDERVVLDVANVEYGHDRRMR
jgi:hypothetical protein